MRFKRIFFVLVISLPFLSSITFSLEPRLLWKKVLNNIASVDLARESADILVKFDGLDRLRWTNKEGITQYEWGPGEIWYLSTSISDDGRFILYSYSARYERPNKVYLCLFSTLERKFVCKEEKWYEQIYYLSPNGQYIANQSMADVVVQDLNGKELLYCSDAMGSIFSPDSKFLVSVFLTRLYDIITGKEIANLEKIFFRVGAVSKEANYIAGIGTAISEKDRKDGIYGIREKRLIWEGKSSISGDGKIIVSFERNGVSIIKRETLQRIYRYPIIISTYLDHFLHHAISFDGRILAIHGEEGNQSKIVVMDTFEKKTVELLRTKKEDQTKTTFYLTNNGKYLLINYARQELLFYQIY